LPADENHDPVTDRPTEKITPQWTHSPNGHPIMKIHPRMCQEGRIWRTTLVRRLSQRPCGHDADDPQRPDLPKLSGTNNRRTSTTRYADYRK
jgi:hypothetical protein